MSDTTNDTKMPGILENEITVTVRGERYVFRIPTIRYDIEVGYKAAAIRRSCDPDNIGDLSAVDMNTVSTAWYGAILELYLIRSEAAWPFTPDNRGMPSVSFDKFPVNKHRTMMEVGQAFTKAFADFRDEGSADGQSAGDQAVAGVENPGA